MMTAGSMGMGFRRRRRHELLPRKNDVARFALLGQVVSNVLMVGSHIPDESTEEPV